MTAAESVFKKYEIGIDERMLVEKERANGSVQAVFTLAERTVDKDKMTEALKEIEVAATEKDYKLKAKVLPSPFIFGMTAHLTFEREEKTFIEKRCKKETTWKDIAKAIQSGRASDLLEVGDRIPFTTKRGIEAAVVVAHIKDNKEVYFVLEDAWEQKAMVDKISDGKLLSWAECDVRKHLQEKVLTDLPDDMAAVISKRTIKQNIGSDAKITEDKLWLLSHTEVFGRDDRAAADGEDEFHFDFFCDERSRVKQRNGETDWWSLRTPRSASSTYFRFVGYYGYASSRAATTTYSVCFGFCIK